MPRRLHRKDQQLRTISDTQNWRQVFSFSNVARKRRCKAPPNIEIDTVQGGLLTIIEAVFFGVKPALKVDLLHLHLQPIPQAAHNSRAVIRHLAKAAI
jgi:hypothetical protein